MSTKTHLARQEESVEESGIQIRESDPETPVTGQTWINTTDNTLKRFSDDTVLVLDRAHFTKALALPVSNDMDGAKAITYYKTVTAAQTVTFSNMPLGMTMKLLLKNTSTNQYRQLSIAVPAAADMVDGNRFHINSSNNLNKYFVWYDFDGLGANEPIVAGRTGVAVTVTQGRKEKTELTFPSAASINTGRYWTLSNANNSTNYYVWYNKDGAGGDPLVVGKTAVQIAITSANTATEIADLTATALDALADFAASNLGAVLTVENAANGPSTDVANGAGGGAVTSLTISKIIDGASPDNATSVAVATAAALNALADFSSPVPVTGTAVITYSDYGTADAVENVDIPTGFSVVVDAVGGGPIFLTLPNNVITEDIATAQVLPAGKTRLFEFSRISSDVYMTYTEYDN